MAHSRTMCCAMSTTGQNLDHSDIQPDATLQATMRCGCEQFRTASIQPNCYIDTLGLPPRISLKNGVAFCCTH